MLGTAPLPSPHLGAVPSMQIGAHAMATAEQLALRVAEHGGGALVIDYGKDAPYTGAGWGMRLALWLQHYTKINRR